MPKKTKVIPVNPMAEEFHSGIAVLKISPDELQSFSEANHSHRHDYHFFLLAEKGTAYIEVDFEKHELKAHFALYIHPDQVHRTVRIEEAEFYLLAISTENLHPKYLKILEQTITPTRPLLLDQHVFTIFNQTITLCEIIFKQQKHKLYRSLLKDYSNAFAGLLVSQYAEQTVLANNISRFDIITKAFKLLLERNFTSIKRPSDYADSLNISTPYLNECVKNVTGFSISYHIQQRIVLEAKRLLYHSDKSVKEIANELGYDDYAYFSRIFTKVAGMTALTFGKRNLD